MPAGDLGDTGTNDAASSNPIALAMRASKLHPPRNAFGVNEVTRLIADLSSCSNDADDAH